MIETVEFKNFKALRDVSIDLERFTVLVGPNGSGKTSVLDGLDLLREFAEPRRLLPGDAESVRRFAARGRKGKVVLGCASGRRRFRLTVDAETMSLDFGDAAKGDLLLASAGLLRLNTDSIKKPSYSDEPTPRVKPDGEGLPSALAHLALGHPRCYEQIQRSVQSVIPSFRAVRTPRAQAVRIESEVIKIDGKEYTHRGEKEYWGNCLEFDMAGASGIPADMMSEGTLLVLALVTVILGPTRPRLLLLDDLDRALHPKAQKDLVGLLRRLMEENSDLQIVATSHSPYLLDHLRPEEVRLTTLRDDGSVLCGRLDQHPEFEKWKEMMTPGEFWSAVGEQWVAEVNKSQQG